MFFILLLITFLLPLPASAQPALLPACAESGNCGFCDIVDVIGRGFEFLLYFLGAVIFFVFMWGAFDMIASRGRSERLEKGKEEMKGALFGALFVLVAWHVINLMVYTLITPVKDPLAPVKGEGEQGGLLFGNPWNWLCSEQSTGGNPCFSRGDGTPCGTYVITEMKSGICIEGVCSTTYANTCDYLKAKYPDEFGSYGCDSRSATDGFVVDCLPDPSFCGYVITNQLCCGLVGAGKNP